MKARYWSVLFAVVLLTDVGCQPPVADEPAIKPTITRGSPSSNVTGGMTTETPVTDTPITDAPAAIELPPATKDAPAAIELPPITAPPAVEEAKADAPAGEAKPE